MNYVLQGLYTTKKVMGDTHYASCLVLTLSCSAVSGQSDSEGYFICSR